jgi:hypothetical protein
MTPTHDPGGRLPRGLPALHIPATARRRRGLRASLVAASCALAVIASACTTAVSAEFQPALDSKEAVAAAVLDALWQRDAGRLRALAVSETEFRKYVWPALPIARAGLGGSVDYWWVDHQTRSLGALGNTLKERGGQRFGLVAVTFTGPATDYGPFRVHREATLSVRDWQGSVLDLRFFGSMIESAHGWKVYSYIID